LDSNEDGTVTPKDATATFKELDADKNAKLDKAEMGVLLE